MARVGDGEGLGNSPQSLWMMRWEELEVGGDLCGDDGQII